MMRKIPGLYWMLSGVGLSLLPFRAVCGEIGPSPENHIYQYETTQKYLITREDVPETPKTNPTLYKWENVCNAYLWVPPEVKKIRAVIVMGHNVPEQGLAGNERLRAFCRKFDLAILYAQRSFMMHFVTGADKSVISQEEKNRRHVEYLQRLLDALAEKSGFEELRTAPWLPIGESGHLLLVNMLTNGAPERIVAGVWLKDSQYGAARADVPMLTASGSGAEWGFDKNDVNVHWKKKAASDARGCENTRARLKNWPGSLLIEAGSAHFSVTDKMLDAVICYLRGACRARLSDDGSPRLKPVDLNSGYVARLPGPGVTNPLPPKPFAEATAEERNLPWYFDRETAQAAYELADVNWNAKSQIAAFLDENGRHLPYNFNGVVRYTPEVEEDGCTFTLHAALLDRVPEGCVNAGAPLEKMWTAPVIEWLCGPAIPLGGNRFRLALDRSVVNSNDPGIIFKLVHEGNRDFRLCIVPMYVTVKAIRDGAPQKIDFPAIPDQKCGVREIPLRAKSDSRLPVHYFVKYGPAVVRGDRLVITELPEHGKFPVEVSVVAWQWGRTSGPRIQTASPVERKFRIIK